MTVVGSSELWTGSRLAARLLTLKGAVPEPVQHIIFRSTRRDDGTLLEAYLVPERDEVLEPATFESWLRRHLKGDDRLALAVLVIREALDARGLIRQCTIERRRGSIDGPYSGDPARVEFAGAAEAVRLYRSHPDGRLTEITPNGDTATPRVHAPEQFAGEYNVLRARFGPDVRVIDSREPALFEEMIGLSSIVHVHTSDGREIGCGVGWHGPLGFVLEADFPRFGAQLVLSPEDAEAVDTAVRKRNLVRGGIRLDEGGIAVVARRQASDALFLLRPEAGRVRIDPHTPGRAGAGPDQQRWLRYVASYEGLAVLDTWRDGESSDLIVLTGDEAGQLWRHHVDADGVETWRKPDDDPAFGALHHEHLVPGMLAAADAATDARPAAIITQPGTLPPRRDDSLLARVEAFVESLAVLREAGKETDQLAAARLRELLALLDALEAHGTAATAEQTLMQLEDGTLATSLGDELTRIGHQLRLELSLMQPVIVWPPSARFLRQDVAPYGELVQNRFQSACHDIDEAAACLALRRPTAAVFHCMRVLERGIAALGRCTNLANQLEGERDWQKLLRILRQAPRDQFAGVIAALDSVRKRWGAPTLLPAVKYTETEAEQIVQAVGTFMQNLSACCDESGAKPLADVD